MSANIASSQHADLELARRVVDALGGPTKTALFFDVRPPSISDWLKKGVPKARLRHLKDVRPDLISAKAPDSADETGTPGAAANEERQA